MRPFADHKDQGTLASSSRLTEETPPPLLPRTCPNQSAAWKPQHACPGDPQHVPPTSPPAPSPSRPQQSTCLCGRICQDLWITPTPLGADSGGLAYIRPQSDPQPRHPVCWPSRTTGHTPPNWLQPVFLGGPAKLGCPNCSTPEPKK